MTAVHLHLALNHLPLASIFFGLAMMTYGLVNKNGVYIRLSFIFFLVAALFTVATFGTGAASQGFAEKLPGISTDHIKPHRDAAKVALMVMMSLAGLLVVGHYVIGSKNPPPAWFIQLAFALGAITMLLLINAGKYGGHIRHPELRPGFNAGEGLFLEGLQGLPPGYTEEDMKRDKQKKLEFLQNEQREIDEKKKSGMDHSGMDNNMDHSGMDHSGMDNMDHSGMDHSQHQH